MEQKKQTAGETAPRAKSAWLQDLKETLNAFQETMDAEKDPKKAIIILAADGNTGEGTTMLGGGAEVQAALIADLLTNNNSASLIADAARLLAIKELLKPTGSVIAIHINANGDDSQEEAQDENQANGEAEQPPMD